MNYSKETIWHFTCEFCSNWWSYATSDEWHPDDVSNFAVYCPHCGMDQKKDEDTGYTGIM